MKTFSLKKENNRLIQLIKVLPQAQLRSVNKVSVENVNRPENSFRCTRNHFFLLKFSMVYQIIFHFVTMQLHIFYAFFFKTKFMQNTQFFFNHFKWEFTILLLTYFMIYDSADNIRFIIQCEPVKNIR